jgi:hypothetical protein
MYFISDRNELLKRVVLLYLANELELYIIQWQYSLVHALIPDLVEYMSVAVLCR